MSESVVANGTAVAFSAPHIYSAVVEVMEKVGAIGKNKVASMGTGRGSYNFRGIDDIYNALQKPMIESKIFVKPSKVLDLRREDKVTDRGVTKYTVMTVRYTFCSAVDGSEITVETVGEAMDTGDKACNKAMSAAFKYACFQLFCIPTEEMLDSEQDTYIEQRPTRKPQPMPSERVLKAYEYVPFPDGDPVIAGKTLKEIYKSMPDLLEQLKRSADDECRSHLAAIEGYVHEYQEWRKGA